MSCKKRSLAAILFAAAATVPSFAMAQTAGPVGDQAQSPSKSQQPLPSAQPVPDNNVNNGALHFGADLNVASSYFFRGYNQEDRGFIFQPNVYVYSDVIKADDDATLSALRVKLGSWNSFHSKQTASDGAWYESDLYGVISATFMNKYYVSVGYTDYTYPDDAFDSIHEIGVSGGVNDLSSLWDSSTDKPFTLPVEVGFYKEISDGNGTEDFYAELKATPTLATTYDMIPGFGKASISFPLVLGTSLDSYYIDSDGHNEFWGYVQGGITVGLPMTFIEPKYGSWTLNAGVNYIQCLADSTEFANDGGESYEVQGVIGISVVY